MNIFFFYRHNCNLQLWHQCKLCFIRPGSFGSSVLWHLYQKKEELLFCLLLSLHYITNNINNSSFIIWPQCWLCCCNSDSHCGFNMFWSYYSIYNWRWPSWIWRLHWDCSSSTRHRNINNSQWSQQTMWIFLPGKYNSWYCTCNCMFLCNTIQSWSSFWWRRCHSCSWIYYFHQVEPCRKFSNFCWLWPGLSGILAQLLAKFMLESYTIFVIF